MPRGRPRKTRVTKEDIQEARVEMNKTSYERKRKVIPGPWTNIETKLIVEVSLRLNTGIIDQLLGACIGSYTDDTNWFEKSWYPICINVELPDAAKLIQEHGIAQVLAATEQALNKMALYGDIILLQLVSDNSMNEDPTRRFLSLKAKTNKKSIKGFRAMRQGELVMLK